MKHIKDNSILLFFLIALSLSACIETYDLPVTEASSSYLVVEGVISEGESSVTLTRTSTLNSGFTRHEKNATVQIENQRGDASITLIEVDSGQYRASMDLDRNEQYRLKIYTADDKEYVSAFVPVLTTPQVDSVTWSVVNNNGIQLYVTTHDPQSNTRYYRWTYEETWQDRSPFNSFLEYVDHEIVSRDFPLNQINICWKEASSTRILTASSVKLQEDVIYKQPLLFINTDNSPKLDVKYSLLVRQYAITKEAFEFWDLLRNNSEELGTLFDAQPSQLFGNISCTTNPDEPVIGFVSAGTVSEKRIFIRRNEVPLSLPYNRYVTCVTDTIADYPEALEEAFALGDSIPVNVYIDMGGNVNYLSSSRYCVDCRARGGTNVQPDFWE